MAKGFNNKYDRQPINFDENNLREILDHYVTKQTKLVFTLYPIMYIQSKSKGVIKP